MPLYTLNRDFTLRNTKGIISFTKGVPVNVPSYMVMDVVSIGAEAVDAETPSLVPVDAEPVDKPEGEDRKGQMFVAFEMLVERNESKDFTGSGVPTVKAVEAILGFDVERSEVLGAWAEFKKVNQ